MHILSLFILANNWLMEETTTYGKCGIRWTLDPVLEDLDCADDLCLLASPHQNMQAKTQKMADITQMAGLNINIQKA